MARGRLWEVPSPAPGQDQNAKLDFHLGRGRHAVGFRYCVWTSNLWTPENSGVQAPQRWTRVIHPVSTATRWKSNRTEKMGLLCTTRPGGRTIRRTPARLSSWRQRGAGGCDFTTTVKKSRQASSPRRRDRFSHFRQRTIGTHGRFIATGNTLTHENQRASSSPKFSDD